MIEIRLENLTKLYGRGKSAVRAVDDVSLTIEPGEFFFLLGPSGCGKTTLLRMIAGLIDPTRGRLLFGGRDVTNLSVQRRNTAMVFQNYALWPHMTVQQNVEFAPRQRGLARATRSQIAQDSLQRVQMSEYARRKPNQLSGGQQQRVALARALAAQPQCLLLDEPLSNLDARLRLHMRDQLRRLVKNTGTTGIYVTHDQKEALSMADRIAVMNSGRVAQVGTPQDLYHRPASRFVADFLGEANFVEGTLKAGGEIATINTAAGPVRADTLNGVTDGSRVTCCVRPEHICLLTETDAAPAGANIIKGTLRSSMYLGDTRQYTVRLDAATEWKVTLLSRDAPSVEPNQPVRLAFAPQDLTVLAD